jgi:hypothetical protein
MPTKLTQEQFIEKAIKKHNGLYDYSLVKYINAQTKVKIICPTHGEFEQQPSNHLFGQGCIRCMGDNVRKAKKFTHIEFLEKLEYKNPEIFTLIKIKSEYVNNNTKILLGSKYGDVLINPNRLLNGTKPCISNAKDPLNYLYNFIKLNNPIIFKKIIKITGKYNGVMNKIQINTIYGDVEITPDSILRGGGFDIRSAIDKTKYLYTYLLYHQPQYITQNIQFISEFKGSNNTIEFTINGKKHISTPTSLMFGYFSPNLPPGIYNTKNIEKNRLENINKKCILYKIKLFNDNECFYKIGITSTPINNRLKQIPYNIEIIELINTNLYDGYYQEQQLHEELSQFKYHPQIKFGGKNECFTKL